MKNRQKIIGILLLCAVSFGSTLPADKQTTDALITDPLAILVQLQQMKTAFDSQSGSMSEDRQALISLIQLYEKHLPIFLLTECDTKDCLLSRMHERGCAYREQFEKKVVDTILNKLEHRNEPVQYVGFGSGGMYQDLVIVYKALSLNDEAPLAIHLIDPQYERITNIRDIIQHDYQINANMDTELSPYMKEIMKYVQKGPEPLPDNRISNIIQANYAGGENSARQFIAFLKAAFPKAQLTLHLHKSGESYLNYIKAHQLSYPDILCAADIDHEQSKAPIDYMLLAREVLKENPNAANIQLAKRNYNIQPGDEYSDKAQLITFSLNAQNGTKELTWVDKERNPIVTLFRKSEDLFEPVLLTDLRKEIS